MNLNTKSTRGITLIALVVSIIVLLILSGISISMLSGDNGILQRAAEAKEKTDEATLREEQQLADLAELMNGAEVSSDGYDYSTRVNAPKLKDGMIPITYDSNKWVVADKNNNNKSWYDYDNKKWANICTVDSTHSSYRTAEVGTEILVEDMTTMFVWIPRYAYSIVSSSNKIDVTFLVGNTNRDVNNTTYKTDYDAETEVQDGKTPMIVHPGFRIGNSELTGIWVAKFESSGLNSAGNWVGNGTSSENSQGSESERAPNSDTYVRSVPNAISWRYITIGESQYRCMQMSSNTMVYGWSSVNTHLMKNSEWGAVAYLCYSKFGSVPMINGCGNSVSGYYYDMYTGMGPASSSSEGRYDATAKSGHEYNTSNGMLASTTGNVYGVYDMCGGAWERVATYLDNGNGYLNTNVKSSSNSSVKYFENGVLNISYSSLWEGYEVSEEEKSNSIEVDGESSNLTQAQLWNKTGASFTDTTANEKYNTARKRLTDATYNLLAKVKGIGVNEVASSHSYYGVNSSGSYTWLINASDTSTNYGRAWNSDYVLIGHASNPFVVRGGDISSGTGAGVLSTVFTLGNAYDCSGFRAVLCP